MLEKGFAGEELIMRVLAPKRDHRLVRPPLSVLVVPVVLRCGQPVDKIDPQQELVKLAALID